MKIKRGDIFFADLSPVLGSEIGGLRYVVIVSNDELNDEASSNGGTVIVAPLSSNSTEVESRNATETMLVDKHELVGSPYNDRRASCERVAAVLGQEFLRGATMEQLDAVKDKISEEDYKRARYVIGEEQRVMDVCEALKRDDYETVGKRMYETHWGMSRDYEVSCEELDFLATVAQELGVAGSRIMGGGFGGCTINLVKAELYDGFIAEAKRRFNEKYGHEPKVYSVVISDGARRL